MRTTIGKLRRFIEESTSMFGSDPSREPIGSIENPHPADKHDEPKSASEAIGRRKFNEIVCELGIAAASSLVEFLGFDDAAEISPMRPGHKTLIAVSAMRQTTNDENARTWVRLYDPLVTARIIEWNGEVWTPTEQETEHY